MDAMVEAFAVVVVGGLGSIWGSAIAALLIGMLKAFGILVFPQFALAFVFGLMALVLIVGRRACLEEVMNDPGTAVKTGFVDSRGGAAIIAALIVSIGLASRWIHADFSHVTDTLILIFIGAEPEPAGRL